MEFRNAFETRLKSLQRLTCSGDEQYPSGILIVPGLDGRHNKGSITMLKFLFSGSIGQDLLQGVLNDYLDALEESVVLIQDNSVSIVYTREAKEILTPWMEACPMLVEYLPLEDEEGDIDALQARKCINFKRMILESLPAGAGVGIPIPLGYDGVLDIESWSLMQSFALDEIFMPTGFFTSRYNVVDVTEFMDVLVRAVDTCHVDNGIRVVSHTILPHVNQSIGVLDTMSADQRARLTVSDVLAPLDMLYEFGELHCAEPADPALRPVLLMGNGTCHLGSTRTQLQAMGGSSSIKYPDNKIGANCHLVMEACEPSTGMRWCRTYFLHKGRHAATLKDAAALVEKEEDLALDQREEEEIPAVVRMRAVLSRLDSLYLKLQHCLGWAVRLAFSSYDDVLEAGQFVQLVLDAAMKGETVVEGVKIPFPERLALQSVRLQGTEQLQVYMDCMNGFGKVVSIEDVDDMGGTCWTYIRVSVHNIDISAAGSTSSDPDNGAPSGLGAVAVGDTFLFSGNACQRSSVLTSAAQLGPRVGGLIASAGFDAYCITRCLPYHRSFIGPGAEDRAVKRFLAGMKSPSMVAALGLGKLLNTDISNGVLTLPLLTDHPLLPHTDGKGCEMRAFSGGFMIEKENVSCLPLLVSFELHVEKMWTCDLRDVFTKAVDLVNPGGGSAAGKGKGLLMQGDDEDDDEGLAAEEEDGLLVVLQLKSFSEDAIAERAASRTEEELDERARLQEELRSRRQRLAAGHVDVLGEMENDEDGDFAQSAQRRVEQRREESLVAMITKQALEYNPLQRSLPLSGTEGKEHLTLAFVVPATSNASRDMSRAIAQWREALRLHDLPDIRGAEKDMLPASILRSFSLYLDRKHALSTSGGTAAAHVTNSASKFRLAPSTLLSSVPPASLLTSSAIGLVDRLGLGHHSLRSTHALNEWKRLQAAIGASTEDGSAESKIENDSTASIRLATVGKGASPPLKSAAQLVVVAGHAGSGVMLIGAQIADRLHKAVQERTVERKAASASGAPATPLSIFAAPASVPVSSSSTSSTLPFSCQNVVLDLSSLHKDSGPAELANLVQAVWADYYAVLPPNPSSVEDCALVVTIVLSPQCHVRFEDLLSVLINGCNHNPASSHVATVVSVTSAASLFSSEIPLGPKRPVEESSSSSCGAESGVGAEVWRASGMQPLFAGDVSDVCVCVDGSADGKHFSAMRSLLASHRTSAVAVRVTPDGLRLEEDVMESILGAFETARVTLPLVSGLSVVGKRICGAREFATPLPTKLSVSEAAKRIMSRARKSIAPAPSLPYLRTLCFLPPNDGPGQSQGQNVPTATSAEWSVNSLLSCMRAYFPSAVQNCDVVLDTWQMPATGTTDTKGLSGFRLATYCAKAKVMKRKQMGAERAQLDYEMRKLTKKVATLNSVTAAALVTTAGKDEIKGKSKGKATSGVRVESAMGESTCPLTVEGVLSVHGVLRIPSGTPLDGGARVPTGLAVLEASEGTIMLRTLTPGSAEYEAISNASSVTVNQLVVHGVLDNETSALLEDIFALCGKYRLPHKAMRSRKDLSPGEEQLVHDQNEHVPLGASAANWTYDGYGYVDYIGNRKTLRPDIEPMLEKYLERQNERIKEYNKMVQEVVDLL